MFRWNIHYHHSRLAGMALGWIFHKILSGFLVSSAIKLQIFFVTLSLTKPILMRLLIFSLVFLLSGLLSSICGFSHIPVPEPAIFFGFKPGADRKLFNYEQLISYFEAAEKASPRLEMRKIGTSPEGRTMFCAFLSSEANINHLDSLRSINKELALNPDLTEKERHHLIRNGKVFILATLSMHSTEVGPSQAAPLIAYDLLTTNDADTLKWLDDVVLMMIPCHNPDGMDKIVEHYQEYVGTKYEGSSYPGVYHKYIGHDNNRDFIILSQEDTKAIASLYNTTWFPQVMVEKHQMGSSGVRYFVPPPHDPIAENVDPGIWNWIGLFGSNMMKDMTQSGLKGVSQHYLFDDYWPGSTETCIWKNVIGFLTECASVQTASPVYIEKNELSVIGKGLGEHKKSINMPDPWEGGWWRLSDIVQYEVVSTMSILKTASAHAHEILRFRNDLCRKEVRKGLEEPPFFYIMPLQQHDLGEMAGIVNLLREQGVQLTQTDTTLVVEDVIIEKGSVVIPLAQPFRAFIKEVMEQQHFPERHYTPGGELIKPYDITSWSLPLHRGVEAMEINKPIKGLTDHLIPLEEPLLGSKSIPEHYWAAVFPVSRNESFKAVFMAHEAGLQTGRLPGGDFLVIRDKKKNALLDALIETLMVSPEFLLKEADFPFASIRFPRTALIETTMHDMDAGWTRFLFDTYHIPYTVIHPGEMETRDLNSDFDVILIPNTSESILMTGAYESSSGEKYPTRYPPEFAKGMGKKGLENLMNFVDQGGIVLSWGHSTELFTGLLKTRVGDTVEEFRLPFSDISEQVQKEGLYCPGSLLRMNLREGHPLTYGMPQQTNIFYRGSPLFRTSLPYFDTDRRVIGFFPERDLLASGYCEQCDLLADKSILIWLQKGKGQIVLYGFNPQFRASTQGTFKLLFNGLLLVSK